MIELKELLIGLAGLILGAFLTLASELYKDYRNRKRSADYLIVRVIFSFDRFFDDCVSVVFDNCKRDQYGQLHQTVSLPNLNLESLDVDWKSIAFKQMYEILNLTSRVGIANEIIRYMGTYASDFDDYFQERQYQYSIIALEVDKLTATLRQEYNIPQKNYSNWNPLTELSDIKEKIENKRKNA